MADFHRLIRSGLYFLVGVLLSAWSVFSYAETYVAPTGYKATTNQNVRGSIAAACTDFNVNSNGVTRVAEYYTTIYDCQYVISGTTYWGLQKVNSVLYCPGGGTLSGTNCINATACTAPQVRDASTGICSAPPCPAAGSVINAGGAFYGGSGAVPSTICVSSCGITPGACAGNGTSFGCTGPYISTGSSCTGGQGGFGPPPESIPPVDPRSACIEKGQAYGTVNGQVVCVAPTVTNTPKTTTTTSPGGNSTTNQTTNTTCTGAGSCTTTTTTTTTSGGSGPGGTGPGSTTTPPTEVKKDLPKSAFCEENPNSSICKNSSFAGTCDAPPACDGDAVQCAQAKASFETKCLLEKEPEGAAYTLGKSIAEGGSDSVISPLHSSQVETRDIGSIISSSAGQRTLSASCIPSQGFTIALGSYSIDTVLFCSFAQIMGYLFVAVASVHAVKMLAGGSV